MIAGNEEPDRGEIWNY